MAMADGADAPALEVRDATVVPPPVDAATAGLERPVGRTIGRYRVCFEIASGGMATVYLASLRGAAGFNKVVALKSIHPHLASDPRFVHMFLDEARIASRLNHANVCQVFDFGEADGAHYLAMEYLAGEPLAAVVERAARASLLDTPEWRALVARIVSDACAGLHAVHEVTDPDGKALDVVHRDVSPHNVFVTYDGVAKVVDFGIARAKHQVHRTETGEIKGNLPYIAPEQIKGPSVDRRADVWSIGVVTWEALTGQQLFKRETPVETMYAVLQAPVLRADHVAPALPAAWADVIERALSRDREARWRTTEEMGRALEALARAETHWPSQGDVQEQMERLFPRGRQRHRERLRLTSEAASELFTEDEPVAPAPPPGRASTRRGTAVLVAGALAMAAAGAAIGIAATRPDDEPAAPGVAAGAPTAGVRAASVRERVHPPVAAEREAAAETEHAPAAETETAPAAVAETATVTEAAATAETTRASSSRRRAKRPDRARRAPAETGSGQLNVVTPDGWAIVYRGGQRLGQTPLRVTLPAGAHTLDVRPFGRTPAKRVRVHVTADETTRTTVRVAD